MISKRIFLAITLFSSISFSQVITKIVVMGDSISEGYGVGIDEAYPALLEKLLNQNSKKKYKIISSSVSGSTTASGPTRVNWVSKLKPNMVLLALGGNDGLRGISVKESRNNLKLTIQKFKDLNIRVILAGMKMPPNYGEKYTKDFYKMYGEIAKEENVSLIPFLIENVGGVKEMNQSDGIHPNKEGHKQIAETVFNFLKDIK